MESKSANKHYWQREKRRHPPAGTSSRAFDIGVFTMAYSLSGERPHGAAFPIHLLAALLRGLKNLAAESRRRQQFTELLELDEHRLWDLGVSRHDIVKALNHADFSIGAVRDRRGMIDVWPPR
jgi:uncharacterized protein YjiS (DUF1127 family)